MIKDYSGLLPKFRPGGGHDPRWMKGVRHLAVVAKAISTEIVLDLFDYYDAARDRANREDVSEDEWHVLRLLGNNQISASKARELILDIRRGGRPELLPFEPQP